MAESLHKNSGSRLGKELTAHFRKNATEASQAALRAGLDVWGTKNGAPAAITSKVTKHVQGRTSEVASKAVDVGHEETKPLSEDIFHNFIDAWRSQTMAMFELQAKTLSTLMEALVSIPHTSERDHEKNASMLKKGRDKARGSIRHR